MRAPRVTGKISSWGLVVASDVRGAGQLLKKQRLVLGDRLN
jgi:hypothetical protein